MAHHGDGPPMKFRKARDDGLIVAIAAVAVHLEKIREQQPDEIQRVRPLRMPGDLRALPGTEVLVKLAAKLRNLLANALELRVSISAAGEMAQLLDFIIESVDLALAAALGWSLFSGGHHITSSMACAPQICRTDSISSGLTVTRCCACSTATEPSDECSSNSTGLGPGEPANRSSSWSNVLSFSASISRRTRNSGTLLRSPRSSSLRPSCNERRVPASSI